MQRTLPCVSLCAKPQHAAAAPPSDLLVMCRWALLASSPVSSIRLLAARCMAALVVLVASRRAVGVGWWVALLIHRAGCDGLAAGLVLLRAPVLALS